MRRALCDRALRRGLIAAALPLALLACNRGEVMGEDRPTTQAPEPGEEVMIDQFDVPTEAEAYDTVSDEITPENVDAELQRLLEEIEGDDG